MVHTEMFRSAVISNYKIDVFSVDKHMPFIQTF